VRVEFDQRNEKLSRKIVDAQMMKVPFMVVVGDKEAENRSVSLRLRDGRQLNGLTVEQLMEKIVTEIKERKLTSQQEPNKEVSH
jgi:threonyl-tRNA synthetase